MSYFAFLVIFLVPPLVVVLVLERRHLPWLALRWQVPALAAAALVYTAPWDRLLIVERVWTYPAGQVIGATLLSVPIEEYGFYVLQTLLVALVTASVGRRLGRRGI